MIFAELEYLGHYADFHRELGAFLSERFSRVESGLQGDSYFWILDSDEKVAIDTFTSMRHQVKSSSPGQHVQNVIRVLRFKYQVKVYDPPELEYHEDG